MRSAEGGRLAVRAVVHVAFLLGPVAIVGRASAAARPEGVACLVALLGLAEVELAAQHRGDVADVASGHRADPSRPGAPGTRLALASALGLWATTAAAIGFPHVQAAWTWLGVPIVGVGIALRGTAIRALGGSFTSENVAIPGRALVTRGIYAHVRHPSDVGLVIIAGGLACLGGSAVALAIAAMVVAPTAALRIVREDRMLAAAYGSAHAAYRREVGAIGLRIGSGDPPL